MRQHITRLLNRALDLIRRRRTKDDLDDDDRGIDEEVERLLRPENRAELLRGIKPETLKAMGLDRDD